MPRSHADLWRDPALAHVESRRACHSRPWARQSRLALIWQLRGGLPCSGVMKYTPHTCNCLDTDDHCGLYPLDSRPDRRHW